MNEIEVIFNRLFDHFEIDSIKELSEKLSTSQSTVSKWRQRSSIIPIKKKCRELGIYNEIFGDISASINNFQSSSNGTGIVYGSNNNSGYSIDKDKSVSDENMLKLFNTIYVFAKDNNKVDELKKDLSLLLQKYI